MLTRTQKLRKVVFSEDPLEYEAMWNKASEELKGFHPEIKDIECPNGYCSYFTYEVSEKCIEQGSVKDEFEMEGIVYTCNQCPHLEKGKNNARKRWPCKYAPYSSTRVDCTACERFYKEIMQGIAKPIMNEAERDELKNE